MKRMTYAGIGSRDTPSDILELMTRLANNLAERGYTLHSGGARGADKAFEAGATRKEIFTANDAEWDCLFLTSHFHPAWNRCSDYAKKLHGRNAYIILGKDLLSPVDFIVCWTPEGGISGGTGQALRIAQHYGIPVRNLALPDVRASVEKFLTT